MKALSTLEKTKLISSEIKRLLNYDCIIDTFMNGHIVTFYTRNLLTSEMRELINISNLYDTNFQVYSKETTILEIVCITINQPTQ